MIKIGGLFERLIADYEKRLPASSSLARWPRTLGDPDTSGFTRGASQFAERVQPLIDRSLDVTRGIPA
jgi:hypothetical protein